MKNDVRGRVRRKALGLPTLLAAALLLVVVPGNAQAGCDDTSGSTLGDVSSQLTTGPIYLYRANASRVFTLPAAFGAGATITQSGTWGFTTSCPLNLSMGNFIGTFKLSYSFAVGDCTQADFSLEITNETASWSYQLGTLLGVGSASLPGGVSIPIQAGKTIAGLKDNMDCGTPLDEIYVRVYFRRSQPPPASPWTEVFSQKLSLLGAP